MMLPRTRNSWTERPASASGRLTNGDVAIVQFLAATERLEADLWEQHMRLYRARPRVPAAPKEHLDG